MKRLTGWGIIGCGDVVFKKSGPSIAASDGSRIVGAMRRDPEKARAFAEEHGVELLTDDAGAVIRHPEVDIVYVATPPSTHKQYVLQAAQAGKHALVEKPMGMNAGDSREMIDACDAAGVQLFVAYYRRFHPHVVTMKSLIGAGRIGRVIHGQIDFASPRNPDHDHGWRVDPTISGGGLFVDVVSHRIDLMVALLGEVADATGVVSTFDEASRVEQVASLAIRFESGAQCAVSGDFYSTRKADRFIIAGTEGVIESERLDGHAFSLVTGDGAEEFAFEPFPAPHLGLVQHIERVLRGEEENRASGRDGMQTDIVLDFGIRGIR